MSNSERNTPKNWTGDGGLGGNVFIKANVTYISPIALRNDIVQTDQVNNRVALLLKNYLATDSTLKTISLLQRNSTE